MKLRLILLLLLMTSLAAELPYNQLTDLKYQESDLVDSIICIFADTPSCVYDAMPGKKIGNHTKQASFYLPKLNIESCKHILRQISLTNKDNYQISFETSTKPIQGMAIHIIYNPDTVHLEYEPLDILGSKKGIIFKLYNKNNLRVINDKSSPLRWNA